jgi:hypothetical protein
MNMQDSRQTTRCAPTALVSSLTTEADWQNAAPVMRVLRPTLDIPDFLSRRAQLLAEGYCLLGVHVGELVVSIASYTISPHVTYGRELLVHDMATLPEWQLKGIRKYAYQ